MAETSAVRKNWAVAVGVAFLIFGDLAQAQPGGQADLYGKWWSVCDNGRVCRTLGTGGTGGAALTVIVSRDPGAAAPVRVSLVTDPPRDPAQAAPWRVLIDGEAAISVRPTLKDGVLRAELSGGPAAALAARLAAGRTLRVEGAGADTSLSLKGAPAALRQIDEIQGRVGGVTALVATGPATAAPPAPPLPVVEVGRISRQLTTPMPMPSRSGKQLRRCERAFGEPDRKPRGEAYGLSGEAILWLAPCGAGKAGVVVLISDSRGRHARPALDSGVQASARLDPQSGRLITFEPRDGLPDCGRLTEWAWTGQAFAKIREREMAECVGLPVDLWPDSFRAVVRRPA